MSDETATVKMRVNTRETLRALAASRDTTMQDLLDKLVEDEWAQQMFEQLDEGYASIREDDAAWSEELEERSSWDSTLADEPAAAPDRKPAKA